MFRYFRSLCKLLLLLSFIPVLGLAIPTILLSAMLRPFAPALSRRIALLLPLLIWSVCHAFFRLSISMKTPPVPKNSAIVISNHISAADFMLINAINSHNFIHAKYAIKHTLRFFPIFYQGCLLIDFLTIRRNFEHDREAIRKYFADRIAQQTRLWFVLFPEGHRLTAHHKAASRDFCQARALLPYDNVLCPRYKGFELAIESLRGSHVPNLVDTTICCLEQSAPTLFDIFLSSKVFHYVCDVRVVPISEIGAPREFLEDAFRRKDRIIAQWKAGGSE